MSEKAYRDRDNFGHRFYSDKAKRHLSKSEKHAKRKLERHIGDEETDYD